MDPRPIAPAAAAKAPPARLQIATVGGVVADRWFVDGVAPASASVGAAAIVAGRLSDNGS